MNSINPILESNLVGAVDIGELSVDTILSSALDQVRLSLKDFATAPDFLPKIQLAFGDSFAPQTAFTLAQDWAKGDVTIPLIKILPTGTLNGAYGGYASATNTIYLSAEFLSGNTLSSVTSAVLEEFGHSVDGLLNNSDSPGDEGQIFAALVQGIALPESELQALKQENDFATIFIDGQEVLIEQKSLSLSGGEGGTDKTLQLDPLPQGQTEKNVTLNYFYEHYSIPDRFDVRYAGKPIVTTETTDNPRGLVSGSKSESVTFKQVQGQDFLNIVVTAPQSGTAWNFSVSTDNSEIKFDGLVGDVIKLDLGQQRGNLTLKSLPNSSKGKLINKKGEDATVGTVYNDKTLLYYVPTVNGAISSYDQDKVHPGVGQVTFDVEDQDKKSITVQVSVTDGFSKTGEANPVKTGTGKPGKPDLDIYTQQQRLAYLGFPGSNRNPLVVNGVTEGNTKWAKQLFNIAVRPEIASARKRIANQDDKSFNNFINSTNAPGWNLLNGAISNLNFPPGSNQSQRFYGTDLTGDFVQSGTLTLNRNLTSTGVSQKNGTGAPSSTHDGGRSIDIDDIPGSYFFKSIGVGGVSYVAAQVGGFVVRDGNTYRAGNPNNPLDVANGVRTNYIVKLPAGLTPQQKIAANAERKAAVTAIHNANLFVFSQTNAEVQTLLDAFAGTPRIFYNDPRFFDSGVIQYAYPHFDHIHFEIPIPQNSASTNRSLPFNSFPVSSNSLDLASSFLTNTAEVNAFPGIIDLGNLEDSKTLTGTISTTNSEQYYSFTIGSLEGEEGYFTTPRDFNLLLDGLSGDVDVELFQDFSEDGIRQDGEVIASSTKSGNESETINLTNLDEGLYYLRVFQKSGDTSFNLSLTVPPLPVPTDNAGNILTNAKNLGVLGNNAQQSDFIGQVDTDDYYRFTLSSTNDLNVDVTDLSNGDLFAELEQDKNNDGILDFDEIIVTSDEEGDTSEKISRTGLAAGDYILHLGRNSGNTNYNLNLSATPSVIPADKAGSTLATAFNLNILTASTQNDFVGNVDPIDYYRFTLTNPSGVTLKLSGLSADADLELSRDQDRDGEISSDEIIQLSEVTDNQDENINITALPAGDYFVKVSQYEGDTTYNLALTPTTATGVDLEVTVTPITTPLTLGENVNYTVTVKNIGASTATGVILKDNLPLESVLNVSAVASKGVASVLSDEISANIGNLNVNESATLAVSGSLIGSGPFSSLIQASSKDTDYHPDNNSVVQRFEVAPGTIQPADLELSLTSDKTTANIDDLVTFQITLTNKGPGVATSIQVKNVLPQGLTFVSSNPQQGSYASTSGIWEAGNIAKDNQAFVDIVTKVTSGGSLSNTAEVIAVAEPDPDSTPNNNNPNEDDQASVIVNPGSVIVNDTATENVVTEDFILTTIGGSITGTSGPNNMIFGTQTVDGVLFTVGGSLAGGEGDDTFSTLKPELPVKGVQYAYGNQGNDNIRLSKSFVAYGGQGNDYIEDIGSGGEAQKFFGNQGNDTIKAGGGNDYIEGNQGNDSIDAGDGNDFVWGGKDKDFIDGGLGSDTLYGNEGNDTINGLGDNDVVWGGQGTDKITGGEGSDTIYGNQDNDTIDGGAGADFLHGGKGNDSIEGGTSPNGTVGDTIIGGEGADILDGGAEFNTDANAITANSQYDELFRYEYGPGVCVGTANIDTITNFQSATAANIAAQRRTDKLSFGIGADAVFAGLNFTTGTTYDVNGGGAVTAIDLTTAGNQLNYDNVFAAIANNLAAGGAKASTNSQLQVYNFLIQYKGINTNFLYINNSDTTVNSASDMLLQGVNVVDGYVGTAATPVNDIIFA